MASPITVTGFKHVGCFEFCEKVQRIQHHPVLTRLFITNPHDNLVTLVDVTFTVSPAIISAASGIPNVREKWFKQGELDHFYYEPYLKTRYKNERKKIFPFSYLLDKYVPMMKIIMKYFTCEGSFSRLYSYHIWLLMHFTRVKMLNMPYYLYRSIEKMSFITQNKYYDHQMQSIFHHSLIKMIVLHYLDQLNIAWDTFISNEIFTVPRIQHGQEASSSSHPLTSIPPP